MARPQVREVKAPTEIQGVASPVSTYIRPADPGRSSLYDLAEGLAAFDQGLGSFLSKKKMDDDKDAQAKAEVDFNRNNQVSWAEAVKTGKVPASASPVYREWYKKSQGNLAGLRLGAKFDLDYQKWAGRHDATDEQYAAFVSDFMAKNIGDEQDPEILAGLAPHIERISSSGYTTYLNEREARLKENARSTTGALITDALEDTLDDGRTTGKTDWDAFWAKTLEIRQEALDAGSTNQEADEWIVQSVLLQAERSADMEVLKLLDKTLPGSEHPLNYDPKVREAMTNTQDRIKSAWAEMASTMATERERQEKLQQEEWWAQTFTMIHSGEEVPEEMIVQLSRRDGYAREKVARYQKEFTELGTQEDPDALLNIFTEIDHGAGIGFVVRMKERGAIRNPETLTKALDRVRAVKRAQEDGGIFNAPTYKDTVKFITNLTGDLADPLSSSEVRFLSSEGVEALYDYRLKLLDWEARNPDATLREKETAAKEAANYIRSRLVPDESEDLKRQGAKQYISDADEAALKRQAREDHR